MTQNVRYAATSRGRAGFVLVSVLWILALLTVVSLGFARRAMLERRMAWYALDREQAQQMARAAAERGLFELRHKAMLDAFDNVQGYTGLDQRWAQPIDLFRENRYFEDIDSNQFREDVCRVVIEDAHRRISLHSAPRELLETIDGLQFRTIDTLIEGRGVSTPGYRPPLIHTLGELRRLQRFTDTQWYGRGDSPGVVDLVAVGEGAGQINVNTAPAYVLEQIPGVEKALVELIMDFRNGADGEPYTQDDKAFRNVNQMANILETSAENLAPIRQYCTTDSTFFTIRAHASRRRGKINAYCTVTVELRGANPEILSWREDILGA